MEALPSQKPPEHGKSGICLSVSGQTTQMMDSAWIYLAVYNIELLPSPEAL